MNTNCLLQKCKYENKRSTQSFININLKSTFKTLILLNTDVSVLLI